MCGVPSGAVSCSLPCVGVPSDAVSCSPPCVGVPSGAMSCSLPCVGVPSGAVSCSRHAMCGRAAGALGRRTLRRRQGSNL